MLLGNYSVLNKGPGRFFGGSTTSAEVQVPSNWQKSGPARNSLYVSETTAALVLYAIPSGNYAGKTWLLPQKSGEMSSRNDVVMSFTAEAAGLRGVTSTGSATMSFPVADMTGGLITSGSGSATLAITGTGQLLASLSAVGSATWSITTNTPILGALAGLSGAASLAITGSLSPYAIGQLVGSTANATDVTPANVADAVLAAMNATPPGVDVKKMNGATVAGTGQSGDAWRGVGVSP